MRGVEALLPSSLGISASKISLLSVFLEFLHVLLIGQLPLFSEC